MNFKRKNLSGATRRKNRYKDWGGKKSFKVDFWDKQNFNKNKHKLIHMTLN